MPEVQYIKNVTVARTFSTIYRPGEDPFMSKQLTGIPGHNPDECIIRSINWNGKADDDNMYLIWCNLTNDIIGSFCGGNIAPHFPQTHIWLTGPVPNRLEFKIGMIARDINNNDNDSIKYLPIDGTIAITMEFVKYKRTGIHA